MILFYKFSNEKYTFYKPFFLSRQAKNFLACFRAKLNTIKKTTKLNLNKDQLTTLNKMHNEVANSSLKTTKANQINKAYSNAAITPLRDENLSNKLLKDCKISPKLLTNVLATYSIRNEQIKQNILSTFSFDLNKPNKNLRTKNS